MSPDAPRGSTAGSPSGSSPGSTETADRTLVLWCPDWPVRAVMHDGGIPEGEPVAVLRHGRVHACSASARADGVRRGMRQRDAQGRCPELVLREHDEGLDVRTYEPVLTVLEQVTAGVRPVRPGTCALRASGPARFYGGEAEAGAVLAERVVDVGVPDPRVGVADGVFAAEHAARRAAPQESVVVPPREGAAFLAGFGVDTLDDPELVGLLVRLGVRTLGDFAALPARDVLARFGTSGALAHRLARGLDAAPVAHRRPPPDLERTLDLEPPLDRVDAVAFSVRRTADDLVSALAGHGLVCTSVWIDVRSDRGEVVERHWMHPRWFDAADLVDRVRWQLQGEPGRGSGLSAPVSAVTFVPDDVAPLAEHADGLWGSGPDEHVHRAMSRVQSMLGHGGVVSAVVGGGRAPGERQVLVPWGDPLTADRPAALPWPGSIPPPAPATVYADPRDAVVVGTSGRPVAVTDRGAVTEPPVRFDPDGAGVRPVGSWAGPWPVDERWWDPDRARRLTRFQVVGVDGSAWLLALEGDRWRTEARYD